MKRTKYLENQIDDLSKGLIDAERRIHELKETVAAKEAKIEQQAEMIGVTKTKLELITTMTAAVVLTARKDRERLDAVLTTLEKNKTSIMIGATEQEVIYMTKKDLAKLLASFDEAKNEESKKDKKATKKPAKKTTKKAKEAK